MKLSRLLLALAFTISSFALFTPVHSKRLHFVSRFAEPPLNIPVPAPAPTPTPQAAATSPSYIYNASTTICPCSIPSPSPSPGPGPSSSIASSPIIRPKVFNVLSFGAVGDGSVDDTQAFKMAWDTCCQATSGILHVPPGFSFLILPTTFTGPCRSSFVFQIDGTIMPPDGPESWPTYSNKKQWLVFSGVNGLLMKGVGVIDGRGEKWWNLPCKPHKGVNGTTLAGPCDSPVAIRFVMSSNLRVQGLEMKNSPLFHLRFDSCQNVRIERLNIRAPALSPNTDGIHVENTHFVKIYHSVVSTGDDCVSIGAGSYDVDIKNITCGPSHGISCVDQNRLGKQSIRMFTRAASIGSLGMGNSRACVSNITVRDSVIQHSDNGVRIKTWQGGFGSVSKIKFTNISMEAVRYPIIIDQYYCLTKNCTNQTSAVDISDVWYTNIKGTYDIRGPPVHLACSDSVPCTSLLFSDIELLPSEGQMVANPYCWNAYGSTQTLTIPPVFCLLEGNPQNVGQNALDSC